MKKILTTLTVFAAALCVLALPALACGQCDAKKEQCSLRKQGACEDGGCPITGKFFKKASFFLENKDAIGLSDEQVKTIRALKGDVKRASIRQKAEMQVWMLDVKDKLAGSPVDTAAIGALIDQGSAGWAASSKNVVEKYAQLKAVLSEDQMAKAKAVWAKQS